MRTTLVAALSSCADDRLKHRARRFLQGLSSDELQYIAEYLGSCILESNDSGGCSRAQLAAEVAAFQCARQERAARRAAGEDQDHKMILLLEYLCRTGVQQLASPLRAHHA